LDFLFAQKKEEIVKMKRFTTRISAGNGPEIERDFNLDRSIKEFAPLFSFLLVLAVTRRKRLIFCPILS